MVLIPLSVCVFYLKETVLTVILVCVRIIFPVYAWCTVCVPIFQLLSIKQECVWLCAATSRIPILFSERSIFYWATARQVSPSKSKLCGIPFRMIGEIYKKKTLREEAFIITLTHSDCITNAFSLGFHTASPSIPLLKLQSVTFVSHRGFELQPPPRVRDKHFWPATKRQSPLWTLVQERYFALSKIIYHTDW